MALLIIHVDLLVRELFNFLGMIHVRLSAGEGVRLQKSLTLRMHLARFSSSNLNLSFFDFALTILKIALVFVFQFDDEFSFFSFACAVGCRSSISFEAHGACRTH